MTFPRREATPHDHMSVKPIPDGFHAVTPYLFTDDAARLIEFIGSIQSRANIPRSAARWRNHACDDASCRFDAHVADATPPFEPMPSSIYLYVTDCDTVYQRALSSGGISVFPMMTLPSGQRYGAISRKEPLGREHRLGFANSSDAMFPAFVPAQDFDFHPQKINRHLQFRL